MYFFLNFIVNDVYTIVFIFIQHNDCDINDT